MPLRSYFGVATPLVLAKEWISTGSYSLDILAGRGFAPGSIVQLYGPSQSRKTTVALSLLAAAQAQGLVTGYWDVEGGFLDHVAAMLGVDVRPPTFSRPPGKDGWFGGTNYTKQAILEPGFVVDPDSTTIERVFEEIRKFMVVTKRSGFTPFAIVDSATALSTGLEQRKGERGDTQMAHARQFRKVLRIVHPYVKRSGGILILIDHLKPTGYAGHGSASEFWTNTRFKCSLLGELPDRDAIVLDVEATKSRHSAHLKANLHFSYEPEDPGITKAQDVLWAGLASGIITAGGGGWHSMEGLPAKKDKFQGETKWPSFYAKHVAPNLEWFEDRMDAFYQDRWTQWCTSGGLDPDEVVQEFLKAREAEAGIVHDQSEPDDEEE